MTPPPKPLGFRDVQAAAREAASQALGQRDVAQAALAAIAVADRLLKVAISQARLQTMMAGIQCGAGCTSCCHQMVGVSVAELNLARQSIDALPSPMRAAVDERIAKQAPTSQTLTQAQWWQARLPCPLLTDQGQCAIHASRPLPCRAMNSSSRDICERSFAGEQLDIPIAAAPYKIYGHAQKGLLEALAAVGQPHLTFSLGPSLARRPNDPRQARS